MEYLDAIQHRRSYYMLDDTSPISDGQIEKIIGHCLTYVPSAFHSETARVVALFGESHARLWKIVEDTLRARVPPERFGSTEAKLKGFAAGHATLLFFEEQETVEALQAQFPTYADNFPLWSQQASGMVQHAVWCALEAEGLGANIQHYNPLIDEQVAAEFDVPSSWRLISQMVVGMPTAEPGPLEYKPLDERLVVKH
ncbi:MAG: nitroreductase family protein [Atopobiaceae bacterium]|jgi:predicted oxidoreductase (fatty acid repression mutant protein)|nr:nitroreductase family protein [Atopobiaceae bacterium]MCH4181506.1 nitroreductase family protein [Atopobiaceae bacterium]MCH4215150.1 nitroreductase family protein [Atopobiaceae bacterium]MCH4230562.1 nitroreductase family protein [Atopobiaceae bacterium]MCH4275904.1 nitroreductase family protein [Atopobiaceae bacterium]